MPPNHITPIHRAYQGAIHKLKHAAPEYASIVCELVENSLDADSGSISVQTSSATQFSVTDDGEGIVYTSDTESHLFGLARQYHSSRHAANAENHKHVAFSALKYGMHGCSLYKLRCMGGTLTVITRPKDEDRARKIVFLPNINVPPLLDFACAKDNDHGTTIRVDSLFDHQLDGFREYHRSFTSSSYELEGMLQFYAYIHQDVSFTVISNCVTQFSAMSAKGDFESRVASIYGVRHTSQLEFINLSFEFIYGELLCTSTSVKVDGLILDHANPNSFVPDETQYIAVNGKVVRSGLETVRNFVVSAWQSRTDRKTTSPFMALHIRVDDGMIIRDVDKNISLRGEINFAMKLDDAMQEYFASNAAPRTCVDLSDHPEIPCNGMSLGAPSLFSQPTINYKTLTALLASMPNAIREQQYERLHFSKRRLMEEGIKPYVYTSSYDAYPKCILWQTAAEYQACMIAQFVNMDSHSSEILLEGRPDEEPRFDALSEEKVRSKSGAESVQEVNGEEHCEQGDGKEGDDQDNDDEVCDDVVCDKEDDGNDADDHVDLSHAEDSLILL
ncbi:hypothetical protein KCU67_g685, partial [Aureobasidium melanogenum]